MDNYCMLRVFFWWNKCHSVTLPRHVNQEVNDTTIIHYGLIIWKSCVIEHFMVATFQNLWMTGTSGSCHVNLNAREMVCEKTTRNLAHETALGIKIFCVENVYKLLFSNGFNKWAGVNTHDVRNVFPLLCNYAYVEGMFTTARLISFVQYREVRS